MAGRIITSHLHTHAPVQRTAVPPTPRLHRASVCPRHAGHRFAQSSKRVCIISNVSAPLAPTEPAQPPSISSTSHAVVVGGSIAGMITAQALSRVFDTVTVLERDSILPVTLDTATKRGGVPQFQQPHLMLLRGLSILESLWPGIKQEFLAAGGNSIKFGRDVHTMYEGIPSLRGSWGNDDGVSASRALYESTIRSQLLKNPKVTLRPASIVTGLAYDDDAKAVNGVYIKNGTMLSADLVVDASGRGSNADAWLADLGYERPAEETINANLVYNTITVRPRNPPRDTTPVYNCFKAPFTHCVGLPVEGGLYQVIFATVGGLGSITFDDFVEHAGTMPHPYIQDFLKGCDPVSEPASYHRTGNRLRKFEELESLPDGLVFVGDSVAAFNPVYGQGMTCSAIAAEALLEALQKRVAPGSTAAGVRVALKGLTKEFQADLAERLAFAWSVATAKDVMVLGEEAASKASNPVEKAVSSYLESVFVATTADYFLYREVGLTMHMIKPAATLFRPDVMLRTLVVWIRRRFFPGTVPVNPL